MKTKEYEYKLNDEIKALIVLTDMGQQHVSQGDKVVVMGTIYLPCREEENDFSLHDSLQFEDRLSIAENRLSRHWGACCTVDFEYYSWSDAGNDKANFRRRSIGVACRDYPEACYQARKACECELERLKAALEMRVKALECAGSF